MTSLGNETILNDVFVFPENPVAAQLGFDVTTIEAR